MDDKRPTTPQREIDSIFSNLGRTTNGAPLNDEKQQNYFDQSTYLGRLAYFIRVTNPLNLFVTDNQLRSAKIAVENSDKNSKEYWNSRILIDSTIHPDTKEKIPLPFRMASFVPTNLVVVAGLLVPNPSTFTLVLWQWINQSVNAAFNFANANKSQPLSTENTIKSYFTATGISVSVALGLKKLSDNSGIFPNYLKTPIKALTPFIAVAAAGSASVYLMRKNEIDNGIAIFDNHNREHVGNSKRAASDAINQVMISRVLIALPALTLPPLLNHAFKIPQRWPNGGGIKTFCANILFIGLSLMGALPFSVALFPQEGSIGTDRIEPEFSHKFTRDGKKIDYYTFNKGL